MSPKEQQPVLYLWVAYVFDSVCYWVRYSSIFYNRYLAGFQVPYTFDCIFDRLYAFLFPCMYIPEVIIGSLLALVLSTLGHSGTILLWFRPSSSFLLGLDHQEGFLVEWFCILPSEELLNSFPPPVMRGLHTIQVFFLSRWKGWVQLLWQGRREHISVLGLAWETIVLFVNEAREL